MAEEMQKHFKRKAPPFRVDLKYLQEVEVFLKKIDSAHQQAGNRVRHFGLT